jgi:hypothetical protein
MHGPMDGSGAESMACCSLLQLLIFWFLALGGMGGVSQQARIPWP